MGGPGGSEQTQTLCGPDPCHVRRVRRPPPEHCEYTPAHRYSAENPRGSSLRSCSEWGPPWCSPRCSCRRRCRSAGMARIRGRHPSALAGHGVCGPRALRRAPRRFARHVGGDRDSRPDHGGIRNARRATNARDGSGRPERISSSVTDGRPPNTTRNHPAGTCGRRYDRVASVSPAAFICAWTHIMCVGIFEDPRRLR